MTYLSRSTHKVERDRNGAIGIEVSAAQRTLEARAFGCCNWLVRRFAGVSEQPHDRRQGSDKGGWSGRQLCSRQPFGFAALDERHL